MSNIIYEDEYDDGYGGYQYDNDHDDHNDHRAPDGYSPGQPNSLDDCPDEEDVGELADALELNRKLKEIMSSGLDPTTMQTELSRLMSGMSVRGGDGGASHPAQSRQPPPLSQVNSNTMGRSGGMEDHRGEIRGGARKKKATQSGPRMPKSRSAGKTFSDRESEIMAKNNAILLKKMIKIQTTRSNHGSIGGYQMGNTRGSAIVGGMQKSSHQINRQKAGRKISSDNAKLLQRLQNVKSTMNPGRMKKDAERNAKISLMRRTVGAGGGGSRRAAPGSSNVFGRAADQERMRRFRQKPTLEQPAWET